VEQAAYEDCFTSGFKRPRKRAHIEAIGNMFRNYKSELNSKSAKKGLDPTQRYKISAGQWAVFLKQRSSDDFKALSESKSELAKRNKYHHHLGTRGYQRKLAQWEQEDEA